MCSDVCFEGEVPPATAQPVPIQQPAVNICYRFRYPRRMDGEGPRMATEVLIYLWWCADALIALWTFGYGCSIPVINLRRLVAILVSSKC